MSGPNACRVYWCFRYEVTRINDSRTNYNWWGPNSNSVVFSLLRNCGVPRQMPEEASYTPGWGQRV